MEHELHPDELAAAEAAERDDPAAVARGWLLKTSVATLCTTAVQRGIEGSPFGSVVPFALTADGRPVVLIADMAAHTANLRRDPRASLFVRQPDVAGDPQAGWRVTVTGTMERLPEGSVSEDLRARYVERVPNTAGYRATHDFAFWWMSHLAKVRYIGGFGRICWLDGGVLLRDPGGAGMAEAGPRAVAHMNEDHADALLELCAGQYGLVPAAATMVDIDRTGFLVRTSEPERLLHFSFEREVGADGLRLAVIEVLQRVRQN